MSKLFLSGFLGLNMLLLTGLGTTWASPKEEPKVAIRTDGHDLVASIQVMANNSPNALWTDYEMTNKEDGGVVVTLRYCLIQNPDLLVRSIKRVKIEWRLKNFAVLPSPLLTYRVEGFTMTPNSLELKALMSQFQLLAGDR